MTVDLIGSPLRYNNKKWDKDTATYKINIYKNGELINPADNTLKASLPRQYYEKSIFTHLVKQENAEIWEVPANAIAIDNTELKLTAIGDELKYQNFITITYTPEPPEAAAAPLPPGGWRRPWKSRSPRSRQKYSRPQ